MPGQVSGSGLAYHTISHIHIRYAMPDASSDAGYALIAVGLCGLLASHVRIFSNPWRRLPSTRTDVSKPGEVHVVLGGDTMAVRLALANIFSALLLAAGNIAVLLSGAAQQATGVCGTRAGRDDPHRPHPRRQAGDGHRVLLYDDPFTCAGENRSVGSD